MIAQPVARYLARFGEGGVEEAPDGPETPVFSPAFEPEPVVDVGALVAAARAEGFDEGQEAAAATAQAHAAAEALAFEQRLEASREAWSCQQADRLAALISMAVTELETNIATSAAEVLRPFVTAVLRDRAVTRLTEAISALTRDSASPAIRLTGPPDLVVALRSRLDETLGVELRPDASLLDVSVLLGQTFIETQLATWAVRLRDGME